jgi:uncharacterized protein
MQFKKLELEDIPKVRPYLEMLGADICDYTIGGMFMWREFYLMEYAIEDGILYTRVHNDAHTKILYNLPIGENIVEGIKRIMEFEKDNPAQLRFVTIEERFIPLFEEAGLHFNKHNNKIYSDYVYLSEEFRSLSGKRNHKRKNHVNQFIKSCENWEFKDLTRENLEEVKQFFNQYYFVDPNANEEEIEENERAKEVLEHYDEYGMVGGVLYADGEITGFSMGEIIGRTLFVHIEKGSKLHPGNYQMLNYQFAERYGKEVERINREEDMGDAGLRKSKLSYHPHALVEKFVLEEIVE